MRTTHKKGLLAPHGARPFTEASASGISSKCPAVTTFAPCTCLSQQGLPCSGKSALSVPRKLVPATIPPGASQSAAIQSLIDDVPFKGCDEHLEVFRRRKLEIDLLTTRRVLKRQSGRVQGLSFEVAQDLYHFFGGAFW